MSADNQPGKDALRDSSLWHEVGIYRRDRAEYPVTLEFSGMRVKGLIYVSNGNQKMETYLSIPLDGGGKSLLVYERTILIEEAKNCLTEGLKLDRKGLDDVKFSSSTFGSYHSFTLTLEGDPWKVWDKDERGFDRRARGFAQTVVNRINRGEDQPLVTIYPRFA